MFWSTQLYRKTRGAFYMIIRSCFLQALQNSRPDPKSFTNKRKIMQLSRDEFIRRYLLHVLPKGLMRIRHYGFLANASYKRTQRIVRSIKPEVKPSAQNGMPPPALPSWTCKVCGHGRLSLKSVFTVQKHHKEDATVDIRLS